MIYTIIVLIIFIILFIFGSFIVPFYTPIRNKLIHIMEPESQYDDNPVYDLLKSIGVVLKRDQILLMRIQRFSFIGSYMLLFLRVYQFC